MKQKSKELEFTGERMIPKLNKGKTLYFEHLTRYFMASNYVFGKRVLDIGCGSGYGSWILKKMGAKKVVGFDSSELAIRYAKKYYQTTNIQFELGDAEKIKAYNENFDVIVSFELIEHIIDQEAMLTGVRNNLEKGGIFIVSTPNKNTYIEDNPFHVHELSPHDFQKKLKKFFKFVYIFDQSFIFSNLISKVELQSDVLFDKLEEEFITSKVKSFLPPVSLEKSRYLVALSSDREIIQLENVSLFTYAVDNFSLKEGVEGMYKIWNQPVEEVRAIRQELNEIKNSKFYKVWNGYCKLKKIIGF